MTREPLWLSVARMSEGIAETPGPASTRVILRWARDIGAPDFFNADAIPWCAVWANRLAQAMQFPLSGTGFALIRARSFETWGQPLAFPVLGAWVVFSRPAGAHVGLCLGERAADYRVFGGNTDDAVGATWIAKRRLVATRWPAGVAVPLLRRVLLTDDGAPVSTDEA